VIGIACQFDDQTQAVVSALEKSNVRLVGHAAASTRKRAVESITPSDEPSAPGQPPHTRLRVSRRTGKARPGQIQRAIVYAHDKRANVAVVGPRHSVLGDAGKAHEFGGEFRDETFDKRPFMGPALDATKDKFGDSFGGSLGGL
jgi:hypothetical protein